MRITTARKLVRYWQTILGLTEWEITEVRWFARDETDELDGDNNYFAEGLKSKIRLRREQSDDDLEETIVHELLHLMIDGHKDITAVIGGNYDAMHERALNRLANVLVVLDRAGKLERTK